jgi:hypothetical protein
MYIHKRRFSSNEVWGGGGQQHNAYAILSFITDNITTFMGR